MVPHPVSVHLQEQQLHCVMWFCRSRYRDSLDMPACVCRRTSYHSLNEWRHLLRPAVWKFVGWNYWNSSAVILIAYSSMNQHSVVARDGAFNIVDKFLHQVQTSIDGWHCPHQEWRQVISTGWMKHASSLGYLWSYCARPQSLPCQLRQKQWEMHLMCSWEARQLFLREVTSKSWGS